MCHGRIQWGFVGDEVEIICLFVLFYGQSRYCFDKFARVFLKSPSLGIAEKNNKEF